MKSNFEVTIELLPSHLVKFDHSSNSHKLTNALPIVRWLGYIMTSHENELRAL